MAERRRLPLLQNRTQPASPPEAEDGPRPPWHWVGFGTVAIFCAWLPLSYVGGAVSSRVMASRFGADASPEQISLALAAMTAVERTRVMATIALPSTLALALSAFGGGLLIGRFGNGAGPREAALAGAITAVIAGVMAWSGALVAALFIAAVAVAFSMWGARVGVRLRANASKSA